MRIPSRAAISRPLSFSALVLALSACGASPPPPPGPPEVGFVTLAAQPVTLSTELTGRTNATEIAPVIPQATGIIEERLFTEGGLVHAGQPLYRIDPRIYAATLATNRAQLESAQASLADAQAKLRRYNSLSDKSAVSAQDIEDTQAAARIAQASVHQFAAISQGAAVNLQFTRVLAPITGRIGRSSVTRGALVTANQATPLATITRLDPIYVDIVESANDLLRLRQSLAHGTLMPTRAVVTLKLDDGSEYPLKGDVEFGEVTVDPVTGAVTLRARFPNPQQVLLPGMFVRVVLPQGTLPRGILAPQQGISHDPRGNATALVIAGGNRVERRQVTVAQAIGAYWAVTGGLRAGDRLIVEGTDNAKPGATVKPVAVKVG